MRRRWWWWGEEVRNLWIGLADECCAQKLYYMCGGWRCLTMQRCDVFLKWKKNELLYLILKKKNFFGCSCRKKLLYWLLVKKNNNNKNKKYIYVKVNLQTKKERKIRCSFCWSWWNKGGLHIPMVATCPWRRDSCFGPLCPIGGSAHILPEPKWVYSCRGSVLP